MSFVPFGQNLQLQSGVPLLKVGSVFAEKLTITKRLEGGASGSMLSSVFADGDLRSVMKNPMAALTSGIQDKLGGLVSQLGSVGGSGGLISALTGSGGLGSAMGSLRAAGDNLVGLSNQATGFFAMLGHQSTVEMAGDALPAAAGMDKVTAPLTSGDFLTYLDAQLPVVVAAVVAGTTPVATATTWVQAQTAFAAGIVSDSAAALAWGEANHAMIATVASVAGALAVPPAFDDDGHRIEGEPTGFQALLATIVQPGPRAAMEAALAATIAHVPPVRVDVAAMTSLED